MGCGGSKQDVATGNTVPRRLLRKASSLAKSKATSSTNDDAKKKQITEVHGAAEGAEKAPAAGAKLVSKDSSEEYFSSRREMESLEAVTGSECADYFSPNEDSDANAVGGDDVEKTLEGSGEVAISEAKDNEMSGPKQEDEENDTKEDDGKSIGEHSAEFKEAIPVHETETELAKSTKKNSGENQIVSES